ncbi:hypothetical protein FRC03_002035 [Tulasnella sp. 419]|nr:hypothetical protein FRC03_002035 [Tulasnella sp. 419]
MPLTSEYDHMDQIPRHSHSSQDLHTHHISPHSQLGPPYSLLLVDKNESNAISYGFGPGGAGGVVVYSGFLDDVLREPSKSQPSPSPVVQAPSPSPSLWGALTSSLGLRSSSPQPPQPTFPTPEQTSRLAVLLAHELSHLILSHHIETLSSGTILIPSIISICVDTIRTVLYPLTFMVGPFVGDALDKTLRVSFEDVTRAGESCTSRKLEIEADIVSTRLLAIAGFDPRDAVTFWEERVKQAEMAALSASQSETQSLSLGNYWKPGSAHGNTQGGGGPNTQVTHPASVERVKSIRDELSSWDKERMTVLKRLLDERMAQSRSESVVAGA